MCMKHVHLFLNPTQRAAEPLLLIINVIHEPLFLIRPIVGFAPSN